MATFKDVKGREWSIELDGLLLDDVQQETGIDLADLSAGGLAAIDQDAKKLVKVLLVLCRDQRTPDNITDRQFSKLIVKDALADAMQAVLRSVEHFFPQRTWSAIQSAYETQKSFNDQVAPLKPMIAKLSEPGMEALKEPVLAALTEMIGAGVLERSVKPPSATGPDATPATPAIDSPENAELTPVG